MIIGNLERMPKIRKGMTLVELMVVLVLLALVATMTVIRFAAPLQKQRVLSVIQQWQSIDFMARKLGRTSDVVLQIQTLPDRTTVLMERDGERIKSWSIGLPSKLTISDRAGNAIEGIRFMRSQGSIDYRVVVREDSFQQSMEIAGGTGMVRYVR